MTISFQYLSDIHLEFRKAPIAINKQCENLVLCGDIGHPNTYIYNSFLTQCAKTFTNVFVVFGNHEYYNTQESAHD
jgi:predicted phosphodiesterase